MKTLKLIAIAITTTAFAAPVFASADQAQLAAQKRAFERLNTSHAATGGSSAPSQKVSPALNIGHPGERVRR